MAAQDTVRHGHRLLNLREPACVVGEWHRRDIRRRGHRVRPRVRIISLGRAVVRVRAVVLVRDRKGVGGTATARLGVRVEVLKWKVRVVGSDLCNIDKEVWRSLSGECSSFARLRGRCAAHGRPYLGAAAREASERVSARTGTMAAVVWEYVRREGGIPSGGPRATSWGPRR